MGKCTKCGINFIGTTANPPGNGICHYCERDELKARIRELETQLSDANYWRQRHCKDAEAFGKSSARNWEVCKELMAVLERTRYENLGHRCSDGWFIERDRVMAKAKALLH